MNSQVSKFGDARKKKSSEEGGVALPFIVKNFLQLDGGELNGNLNMNGNFIKNIPDPVDGQDAVTKNYVDSSQGHSFFRRIPGQGYAAVKDLDMNENRLLNLGMPTDNREAANKLYTDITANDVKQSLEGHNPFYLNTDKHKARGSIDMLNFKVEGLPMPVEDKDAANKIYVDTLTEDRRRKLEVNNPFSFDNGEYEAKNKIDMKGFKIENVGFPDLPEDVATVGYVDEANVWERKNGGFVAKEHIYLGKKKLGGLREPSANGEAANKKYVDEELEKVKGEIKEEIKRDINIPEVKDTVSISKNTFVIQAIARGPFNEGETPFFFVNTGYSVDLNNLTEPEKLRLSFYFFPFNGRITGYFMETINDTLFNFKLEIYNKPEIIKNKIDNNQPIDIEKIFRIDKVKYERLKTFVFRDGILFDENFNRKLYNRQGQLMCIKEKLDEPIIFNSCQCFSIKMIEQDFDYRGGIVTLAFFLEFDDDEIANTNLESILDKKIEEKTANLQPANAGVDPAEIDKIKTDLEKNQAFNTRNQKTFNARGNINMKQKTIRNIPDPVEVTDVVSKGYVDEMKEFFEDRIKEVEDEAKETKKAVDRVARLQPGGGAGNGNSADFGDMKGKKLINVGDPENPGDGANRKYVDQKTPFTKTNGYYTSSHGLNMDLKKITNLNTPTADGDASNKKYVDDSIENIETGLIKRNGGFMAVDAIDMNSNRIKNVGAPQVYDDAVNKRYVDDKDLKAFEREGEYIKSKQTILMDGKTIEQLGGPNFLTDAVNKEYVDEKLKTIPFTKVNGHFLATNEIDMGVKKITNLALPVDDEDAVNKDYVDELINKLSVEDQKRKTETDRIRVLVNDKIKKVEDQTKTNSEEIVKLKEKDEETKKVFPKEIIYKTLGTSTVLIRGEVKGPIVGIDEIKNINRRVPSPDGGTVAIGDDGNPIFPSIVYFGKYDGGDIEYDNILGSVKIKPNYLIPFKGNIMACSIVFVNYDDEERGLVGHNLVYENIKILLRISESKKPKITGSGYHLADAVTEEKMDYSKGLIQGTGLNYEYTIQKTLEGEDSIFNRREYKICISPPEIGKKTFNECSSIIIYFASSHPTIRVAYITLAVQIHYPDYSEAWLPTGFDI